MPKRVDHERRRDELSRSVWTIAATRGLHAASLREVAAEAGVSMGTVQHYFHSRERMVHHACQRLADLAAEGLRTLTTGDRQEATPREVVFSLAVQTLPVIEDQRAGAGVWQAFLAHALLDPGLAAVIRCTWDGARELVTDQLHRAQNTGELHADVDPDAAATHLLALLDGLISRLVLGDLTPEHALRVVEDHLDHVFTPGAG